MCNHPTSGHVTGCVWRRTTARRIGRGSPSIPVISKVGFDVESETVSCTSQADDWPDQAAVSALPAGLGSRRFLRDRPASAGAWCNC
jgi:hypothetical protein